jgi:hypothetical protein
MSNTSPLVGLFLAREVKVKNLSFDQGNYTRNIIVNNADYWLGLLHWDQGATTIIPRRNTQTN